MNMSEHKHKESDLLSGFDWVVDLSLEKCSPINTCITVHIVFVEYKTESKRYLEYLCIPSSFVYIIFGARDTMHSDPTFECISRVLNKISKLSCKCL